MPRLSCWLIRLALVDLVLGFAAGALMLTWKAVTLPLWAPRLWPAHVELLLFGWTLQLAMGVAFWIFPRFQGARGDERPAWAAFWLLNAGVWTVALAGTLGADLGWIVVGRAAEAAAVLAMALHLWPRVKPAGAGRG